MAWPGRFLLNGTRKEQGVGGHDAGAGKRCVVAVDPGLLAVQGPRPALVLDRHPEVEGVSTCKGWMSLFCRVPSSPCSAVVLEGASDLLGFWIAGVGRCHSRKSCSVHGARW